jgi:hypothetical protein
MSVLKGLQLLRAIQFQQMLREIAADNTPGGVYEQTHNLIDPLLRNLNDLLACEELTEGMATTRSVPQRRKELIRSPLPQNLSPNLIRQVD